MAPFIIHAKDSGAPLRGLTEGVMQGMELRRQWEQDERLTLENARKDEEWDITKGLLAQQQEAGALANEMATLEIGEARYRQRLREEAFADGTTGIPPERTSPIGIGGDGTPPKITPAQQHAFKILSAYDPKLAQIDSWWQGTATDPEISEWMENFVRVDAHNRKRFAAGMKTVGGLTREQWQNESVNELKSLKARVHSGRIQTWLNNPRNHPLPENRERFFKGLHDDNWDRYEA